MNEVGGALANPAQFTAVGRPTIRNPLMTFLKPIIFMFGGVIVSIIGSVLGGLLDLGFLIAIFSLLGSLVQLVGLVYYYITIVKMHNELASVAPNLFPWWHYIIPYYNIYLMLLVVPKEVAQAKQAVGAREPARPWFMYILFPYALASDLNDIARAQGAQG